MTRKQINSLRRKARMGAVIGAAIYLAVGVTSFGKDNSSIDPHGKERIVTPGGDVVACVTGINADEATGFGYVSHFATCPNARSHRR